MTPSDLLQSINLSEYLSVFSENALDEASLRTLSDEDLKELGVAKLGHRKKILDAIAKIPASGSRPSPLSGFVETFPNVVALPLREYLREEHPVVRLWTMCDTIELLLRLFAVVLVAGRRQADGGLPDDLARRLANRVEKPTMGIWFEMSKTLASGGADKEGIGDPAGALILGGLKSFLYGGPDEFKTLETSFLRLRNRLAHGAGMPRAEAERLLAIWQGPFERTVQEAYWLADWELIGRDDAGEWRLLRGCGQHTPLSPRLEAPDCGDADAVWLRTGGNSLLLWPLALFGKPSLELVGKKAGQDHAQIYSSKEAACLTYTPLGCEELCESESGPDALAAFQALFRLNEPHKNTERSRVPDFLHEIRSDATQMVGREEEIELFKQSIKDRSQGVLWMSGTAGMGKSFLMAKITTEPLNEASDTVILPYRFRAGDVRCTRESFADFVEERLPRSLNNNLEINAKAAERLESVLGGLKGRRVILILDGLDEIARRDPGFAAEIPLKLRFPGVLWVLAGRPEADLERDMREYAAERLFENGLPPMSAGDIRTMILNKIGPLRKKLLVQDHEQGEQVINPFIELVTKRAAGLPLYVKYVIGDVLAGKYRVLDAHEDLPASLHAYHEDLLRRLGVGDLQGLLTPLVACLAVAYEPLTLDEIDAVLRHGKVPVADSDAHSLVKRGLAAITAMVTSAPNSDGENGFALFHQSLRDHMLQSKEIAGFIAQTKENFAELAAASTDTQPLKNYLLRCGIRHLLDVGQNAAAEKLLLDVNHLAEISKAGIGDQELYNYWRTLGGQDRAAGYLESVPAFLQSAKEDDIEKVFIVTSVLIFASWVEVGIQVAKFLVDKYRELGMDSLAGLNNLAYLLQAKGDLVGAEKLSRRVIEALERKFGSEHPDTPTNLSNLASVIQDKGDLVGAEPLFRRSLETLERTLGPEHPSTLTSSINLACLLQAKGDLVGAEPLFRRSLEVLERTLGPEHPSTLTGLNNLALLLQAKGDFAGAEPFFRRSLEIRERVLGPEHPHTLTSLNNLAMLLQTKGDLTGAEPLYRSSLEALERTLGSEHPHTLGSLSNLAALLQAKGDLAGAESLSRSSFKARERTLGPQHPDTLGSLSNLAALLQAKGDLAGAESLSRRSLEALERTLGSEHPSTLTSLSNLALLLQDKGDLAGAEPLSQRALEVTERALGPEHPSTLASLNNLAALLRAKGDLAGAEPLSRRALKVRERTLGPEHPSTLASLNNVVVLLYAKGDLAEAEKFSRRALEITERTLGPEHPSTLTSLSNLAMLLHAKGDLAEAEKFSRRALEITERTLGPEHPSTLTSSNNLAGLLQAKCDLAGAELLYRRTLEAQERTLGPEHHDTLAGLNNLAFLLQARGDLAAAEPLSQRALEITERVLGPEHPDTLTSLSNLANLLKTKGDLAGAETLSRRALEIRERMLGPEHPATLTSLNNLAVLLYTKGDLAGAETLCRRGLKAMERTRGPVHPDTLSNLSNLDALLKASKFLFQPLRSLRGHTDQVAGKKGTRYTPGKSKKRKKR